MADSIKIAVRVRPFNQKEIVEGTKNIVEMEGQEVRLRNPDNGEIKKFGFHRCYWSTDDSLGKPAVDNTFLFNDIGKQILDHIYQGYNSTVFAYGQTGSGKSYSIEGYEEKGILQMCLDDIFNRKKIQNNKNGVVTEVRVTYLEIYNEKLRDLVNPNPDAEIKVQQAGTAIFIQGVDPVRCQTYDDVFTVFKEGKKIRVVGAHAMNKNSSRSHAVFTIYYKELNGGKIINAKFNIVDLAGSERQSKTGATGVRQQEANNINKSLTNLGIVIEALAKNCQKKTKDFVPYRNSLLTHILSESLCGNSKTFMIAAISPADSNYQETLGTLRFAQRASMISTNSKKNVQGRDGYNKELLEEIERLKKELQNAHGKEVHTHSVSVEYITLEEQRRVEELNARIAQMMKQLDQNKNDKESLEKLLKKDQQMKLDYEKARDKMLKDAGIQGQDSNIAQRKFPYIMNISEDPTLAGMLIYNLKEAETKIGTKQSQENQIKLNALGISTRHCTIFNEKDKIFIQPQPECKVFVNGALVTKKLEIYHLDRLTLGHANTFKLIIPGKGVVDDLRQSLMMGGKYGQFLDDKLNQNTIEAKSMKQFLNQLEHRLEKHLFARFLQKFKTFYQDVDEANEFTFTRYKKYPLKSKNLHFRVNAIIDIENYMKGVPELIILCEHKETKEVLFVWTEEKFQNRLAAMQSWYQDVSGKNQSTFYQFDPWFDASDSFIKEKQKLQTMKNRELLEYWTKKQTGNAEIYKDLLREQKQILQKLKNVGYSETLVEDYADSYFRGFQVEEKVKKKIQEMRKKDDIHKQIQRFMQCCAEVQKCNMDNKAFNQQKERYINQNKKTNPKEGNMQQDQNMLQENVWLNQKIDELQEELRKKTLQLSKNKKSG